MVKNSQLTDRANNGISLNMIIKRTSTSIREPNANDGTQRPNI